MRAWAVSIVYIYVGIQLFNWVTGLHWLSEFTWPLTIVSGLGLAIASQPLPSAPKVASPADETSTPAPHEPASTPAVTPPTGTVSNASEPSISFTIRKNVRPQ